jgi:hypothetical protein
MRRCGATSRRCTRPEPSRVTGLERLHHHKTFVILAGVQLRRYVDRHMPKLRTWRAAWIRRVPIVVPGRLVRSGRVITIHMAPRPALEEMRN